jgi:hypothetical protein
MSGHHTNPKVVGFFFFSSNSKIIIIKEDHDNIYCVEQLIQWGVICHVQCDQALNF